MSFLLQKENSAICDNMDKPEGHHANKINQIRERQILYDVMYIWNLKASTRRNRE